MTISVIFARNHANIIGVDQKLPWSIREDMYWFKKHTLNKAVIMGRNTFESFGSKLLPNRLNIVLSKLPYIPGMLSPVVGENTGYRHAFNMREALAIAKKNEEIYPEVFIIGGASVIKDAMSFVDRIYMTTVGKSINEKDHKEVTKLDVKGLEGYFNDYLNVDDNMFKLVEGDICSHPDRMTGHVHNVHYTVHHRVSDVL